MATKEDFAVIIKDIARHANRAEKSSYLEFKREAADNLYPLLEAFARAVDDRFDEVEEAVWELVDETESMIQPELAADIYGLAELGVALCDAIDALALDDIAKKRMADLTVGFRVAANELIRDVAEVAIEPDDDSDLIDEDPDDEDDEDEDEEDGEDEVKVADPVAAEEDKE